MPVTVSPRMIDHAIGALTVTPARILRDDSIGRLAVGCRALVIPEQVTVPNAADAFGERDELKDERAAAQLKLVLRRLVDYVQMLGLEDR